MTAWGWWIVVAVLFGAGELHTGGFFLAPFALAAIVGMIVSFAGAGAALQVVLFVVAAALTFGLLRPLARSHMRTPPALRTGTAALIGRPALVLERVSAHEGSVRIDGEVWTARTYLSDEVLEAGAQAQVIEIRGATALVSQ